MEKRTDDRVHIIRVASDLDQRLRAQAAYEDRPMTRIWRQALAEYLVKHRLNGRKR